MTAPIAREDGRKRPYAPSLRLLFLIILANVPSSTALALYPERPVTIVVPFAPGGANDIVVRIIQQPLGDALGQPIVVENRGGAGGNIAFAWVARARPDGYTLLLAPNSFAVNPSLYDKVAYDPFRDFEPVAEISSFPVMFAVRADLGVNTLAELIARAREKPGSLNYATPGPGTLPHLATELLKQRAGIDMVHIPYAGAAPAAQALIGKTVDLGTLSISVAMPHIQAGLLKGLAVTGAERWPDLPDVPDGGGSRRAGIRVGDMARHPRPGRHAEGDCRSPRQGAGRDRAASRRAREAAPRRLRGDRPRTRRVRQAHRRGCAEVEGRDREGAHQREVNSSLNASTCRRRR